MKNSNHNIGKEALILLDEESWVWPLVLSCFSGQTITPIRQSSNILIRQSWSRLKESPCIIIYWENKLRHSGSLVEEILDIDPDFDVGEKIIILTTNPIHEDVVYFSELGVKKIARLRHREKDLIASRQEITKWLEGITTNNNNVAVIQKTSLDQLWTKLLKGIDKLTPESSSQAIASLEQSLEKITAGAPPQARGLDAKASLMMIKGDSTQAIKLWQDSYKLNPNYFRTTHNLIRAYRSNGQFQEAYQQLLRLQMLNRSHVGRLVLMGEVQASMGDDQKAEHYFKSAVERDPWCSGALNGLADIKFRSGELASAREMLAKSALAYRYATHLNNIGIELVRQGLFESALELYSKAQFVLPQQEKGPQLFYNIGLCYTKWNKPELAREFLKLALIKEPNYKKAQKLLEAAS